MTETDIPGSADPEPALRPAPPPAADRTIDITGEICPMTFVRTRLALDRMVSGEVLEVRLRGAEPREAVPRTAQAQGHAVLDARTDESGVTTLWIRRK